MTKTTVKDLQHQLYHQKEHTLQLLQSYSSYKSALINLLSIDEEQTVYNKALYVLIEWLQVQSKKEKSCYIVNLKKLLNLQNQVRQARWQGHQSIEAVTEDYESENSVYSDTANFE